MKRTRSRLALLLALLLALHGSALAEMGALQDMLNALNGSEAAEEIQETPEEETEPSALDTLQDLLNGLGGQEEAGEEAEPAGETGEDAEDPPSEDAETADEGAEALPSEEDAATGTGETTAAEAEGGKVSQADYALLPGYDLTSLNGTVALQVPSGWGSDAGISESMISYSPTNGSGVADPGSSALSTIWYDDQKVGNDKLSEYVDNIRKEYIFSDVVSEPSTVAGQPAIALSYNMVVGTNRFRCRSACFVYDDILYSVEMCQGDKSTHDYFPVLDDVVASEALMEGEWDFAAAEPEPTEAPAPTEAPLPTQAPAPEAAPTEDADVPVEPTEAPRAEATAPPQPVSQGADLGEFAYTIHGHAYRFPTSMGDLIEGDIPIDTTLVLSAEKDASGPENALSNTLYFMLAGLPHRELIGVTNPTGGNAPMTEGVLTALVDTQAAAVDVELPGGVRVGAAETAIAAAFPEFAGRAMDGLAGFRGNELLYACNVRDDGCNGYALIRNDAPYCSALTIICEGGVIREINFQCLGAAAAQSIFEG